MNREASGLRPQTSGKEEKERGFRFQASGFRLQASGKEEERNFRP
jgi:hypothetical protein